MAEDVLEVFCNNPETAMGEIERLPEVKEVALFGRGLHVVTENAAAAVQSIRQLLGRQGYRIERAEKITPSLEDVFVFTHRGPGSRGAAARGGAKMRLIRIWAVTARNSCTCFETHVV